MASLDGEDRDAIARDDLATLRSYLRASAESGGAEGSEGEASASGAYKKALSDGRPGLGDPRAPTGRDRAGDDARPRSPGGGRASLAAPEDPASTRASALREAQTFGVIGLLAGADAPGGAARNLWGEALGGDGRLGPAWAGAIDLGGSDASDLLLSGGGEGGGGRGEGIDIGTIGTIGHCGESTCAGMGQGFGVTGGHGIGRLGRAYIARSPSLRCGYVDKGGTVHETCTTQINGRLPPEVIQRIMRQNHGRFRLCYEQGLKVQPTLEGRVAVKFVIGRDGAVAMAMDGGSDLADADVVACIVRAVTSISFPQPEGGIVTVVYPLLLSPE
jgi:hypothetical protein